MLSSRSNWDLYNGAIEMLKYFSSKHYLIFLKVLFCGLEFNLTPYFNLYNLNVRLSSRWPMFCRERYKTVPFRQKNPAAARSGVHRGQGVHWGQGVHHGQEYTGLRE